MEKGVRILVVEDDPDIGSMLKMLLEHVGYNITLHNNVGGIQKLLNSEAIDLIILDMLIGNANGTDVCKNIRSNFVSERIPILMISAVPEAKNVCIKAGASEFLSKPFEMSELLETIDGLVKKEIIHI